METAGSKPDKQIIDKRSGKELTGKNLAQALGDKTGQWSEHPISHWQCEAAFRALIH